MVSRSSSKACSAVGHSAARTQAPSRTLKLTTSGLTAMAGSSVRSAAQRRQLAAAVALSSALQVTVSAETP